MATAYLLYYKTTYPPSHIEIAIDKEPLGMFFFPHTDIEKCVTDMTPLIAQEDCF